MSDMDEFEGPTYYELQDLVRQKGAEIETLRTTYDSLALHCTQREALLQSLIALRNEQTTEIAALRTELTFETNRLNALWSGEKYLRERDQAEITALREEIDNHAAWAKEFSADSANGAIMAAQREIAELRAAVRDIDGFIGTSRENELAEWHRWEQRPEVRRALEEKP